jgi:hypothetical protein
MPRTKLNRNGAKRNRKSSSDEKLQQQLKDLDAMGKIQISIIIMRAVTSISFAFPVQLKPLVVTLK